MSILERLLRRKKAVEAKRIAGSNMAIIARMQGPADDVTRMLALSKANNPVVAEGPCCCDVCAPDKSEEPTLTDSVKK